MIRLDKKVINADLIDIFQTLKQYIMQRDHKVILKDIHDAGENVMITCPFHKGGNERRPSCGVSKIDKEDHPAGTVHCFTCGRSTSFDKLISYLLGTEDSGAEGKKWLLANFDISYTRQLNVELRRADGRSHEKLKTFISEMMLQEYRFYHPYMYKRGLTNEIIEKYDIGYDKYNNMITFPVRDIKGNCIFLAKRSVKGKMFILPSGLNKPLYGVFELDYNKHEVFIVESFFNALTLAKWGYNAIALMGTGSSYQYDLINALPFRTIHICLDGDAAGRIGTIKLMDNISSSKLVVNHVMLDGKDVNDLTEEEFNNLTVLKRSL